MLFLNHQRALERRYKLVIKLRDEGIRHDPAQPLIFATIPRFINARWVCIVPYFILWFEIINTSSIEPIIGII